MWDDSREGLGEQGPVLDQMMSRSRRNSVTGYLHKLYQGGWWIKGGLGGVIREKQHSLVLEEGRSCYC